MTSPSRIYLALGDSVSIDDYAGGKGQGAASPLFLVTTKSSLIGAAVTSYRLSSPTISCCWHGTAPPLLTLSGARWHCSASLGIAPGAIPHFKLGGNDFLAVFSDLRALQYQHPVGALRSTLILCSVA